MIERIAIDASKLPPHIAIGLLTKDPAAIAAFVQGLMSGQFNDAIVEDEGDHHPFSFARDGGPFASLFGDGGFNGFSGADFGRFAAGSSDDDLFAHLFAEQAMQTGEALEKLLQAALGIFGGNSGEFFRTSFALENGKAVYEASQLIDGKQISCKLSFEKVDVGYRIGLEFDSPYATGYNTFTVPTAAFFGEGEEGLTAAA